MLNVCVCCLSLVVDICYMLNVCVCCLSLVVDICYMLNVCVCCLSYRSRYLLYVKCLCVLSQLS